MARKTTNAGISMPFAMLEQIDKMAAQRGVTRSDFMQMVFRQWLRMVENKKPDASKKLTLDDGLSFLTAAEFWCLPRALQIWPSVQDAMNEEVLDAAKTSLDKPTKQHLLARYLELADEDLYVDFN